jgi:acyl transferase domain-containing protein
MTTTGTTNGTTNGTASPAETAGSPVTAEAAAAVTGAGTGASRAAGFPASPGTPRVLAVSARDEAAAAALCLRLAARLERDDSLREDDVAVTLAHGRERFAVRHAVTGTDRAELAAALRRSAGTPRPKRPAGPLVLDLGDGSVPGLPELPPVAAALACADGLELPPGADREAARAAAVLHGVGAWLAAHGLRPDAVLGQGPAAAAAAALRGALPLSDALHAAATHGGLPPAPESSAPGLAIRVGPPPARRDDPADILTATASTRRGFAPAIVGGASLVRHPNAPATPPAPDPGLHLDPLEPASYARLFVSLWERGVDVDCSLGATGRRIRLPGYPFQRSGSVATPPPGLRPLTPHEQRWLFHDLVRSGSAAEHVRCATAVLPGRAPDEAAAEAALAGLLRRHPGLRTVFTRHAGRWFARTSEQPLPVRVLAPDGDGEPVERVRAATVEEDFTAADAPLVRCAIAPADGHWAVALAVYAPVAGTESADELLADWAGSAVFSALQPAPAHA